MIAVSVADEHVLDRRWIEAQLLHSAHDFVLDRIIKQRVDDDDAGGGGHRPCRIFRLAEPVEIIEDADRFSVPLIARRYGPGRLGGALTSLSDDGDWRCGPGRRRRSRRGIG